MPPIVAAFFCALFILWLFIRDRKRREVSTALWLPLTWLFIMVTKPLSFWFGFGKINGSSDQYVEGSPFDSLVFLFIITAGWIVLARRGINWSRFYQNNRWICIYFLYLGISALWSDYSFVSLKRWIKDFGNVIMVLIVLTETHPLEAVKTLLARCTYLLIPLSVIVIKYYPELGRYYDRWTYQPHFGGLAADKNLLGMSLFLCGLSLMWILLELRAAKPRTKDKTEFYTDLFLMLMTLWLLAKAESSTATSCTALGCAILLGMKFPFIRRKAHRVGTYGVGIALLFMVLHVTLDLGGILVQLLGRDLTFTGRTDIWANLLQEPINPLVGEGYSSFWMGDRVAKLSEKYFYHLNEAHNGYLEIYLNGGLIGLFLLLMLFASAARNIRKELMRGSNYGALRFAFVLATMIYGVTEAVFRFGPIWFVLLLLLLKYPASRKAAVDKQVELSGQSIGEPQPSRDFAGSPVSPPRLKYTFTDGDPEFNAWC